MFDIRMPAGDVRRLFVAPELRSEGAHLNPVAIAFLPPQELKAGLGGTYTVTAWAQFAERDAAERVFAELLEIATTDEHEKQEHANRRTKVNRRNGKLGGAPLKDDPGLVDAPVKGVRERLKLNANLGMKRACEIEIKKHGLTIGPPALRKHVLPKRRGRV